MLITPVSQSVERRSSESVQCKSGAHADSQFDSPVQSASITDACIASRTAVCVHGVIRQREDSARRRAGLTEGRCERRGEVGRLAVGGWNACRLHECMASRRAVTVCAIVGACCCLLSAESAVGPIAGAKVEIAQRELGRSATPFGRSTFFSLCASTTLVHPSTRPSIAMLTRNASRLAAQCARQHSRGAGEIDTNNNNGRRGGTRA